jgi:acylphosphatase
VASLVRLEATVLGRVQGVGFRYFLLREADRLDLTGWVANEHDGSVRAVAEGPVSALDEFEAALRRGPPGAWVDEVRVVRMPAGATFQDFSVRSAGHRGD